VGDVPGIANVVPKKTLASPLFYLKLLFG